MVENDGSTAGETDDGIAQPSVEVDAEARPEMKPRDGLSAPIRILLRAAFTLLLLIIVAASANAVLGFGGTAIDELMRTWAAFIAYVLAAGIAVLRAASVRKSRAVWILVGLGLTLYAAGNLLWALWLEHLDSPPIPSISDALWLSLYPVSYAGLVLLARGRGKGTPAGVWLDGIIAGLGIAALGAAIVVGPVLDSASGSTVAVATNLAYPVADLLLAALVVGILALRGWRLDRSGRRSVRDSCSFQPIAEARGSRVVGMEALVRWAHPARGLLAPNVFVPLAEQSGLMRELTRWVLGVALQRCRSWQEEGHDLRVSVNVPAPRPCRVRAFPGSAPPNR